MIKHNDGASYDIYDDLHEIGRNRVFQDLLNKLTALGAKLDIYLNDRKIFLEFLDNWFNMLDEIEEETEIDIDRESEEL